MTRGARRRVRACCQEVDERCREKRGKLLGEKLSRELLCVAWALQLVYKKRR